MQDLLPDDANALVRAVTWMFAALNTVEVDPCSRNRQGRGARQALVREGIANAGVALHLADIKVTSC